MELQLKKLLILLLFIVVISSVDATVETLGTFEQGECLDLLQVGYGLTTCNITSVTYPNSTGAIGEVAMTKLGTEYSYNFCLTDPLGTYIVNGFCSNGTETVVWAYDFDVTPNGEIMTVGKALINIGLLSILIIFFIACIMFFIHGKNLLSKVSTIGLGYLLLIAITFISWNMASDFLSSVPFVPAMFRILFFVLMAGLFPLLLGGFAWYFFMLWKIKEIQDLMNKGMSMDEAERRQGRKYR